MNIEKMKEANAKLASLLADPHEGLSTWNGFLIERVWELIGHSGLGDDLLHSLIINRNIHVMTGRHMVERDDKTIFELAEVFGLPRPNVVERTKPDGSVVQLLEGRP